MIGYGLDVDDTEDDGMKNVLDFVFSSPKCEELYVAAELIDGSRLIKKLLRVSPRPVIRASSTVIWGGESLGGHFNTS